MSYTTLVTWGSSLVILVDICSSTLLGDLGKVSGHDFTAFDGSEVASEKFTLMDDPTVKDAFGVRAFDDEGVPTRRNIIVDKGILKTYLHNSTTAKKFGVQTTGNAGLALGSNGGSRSPNTRIIRPNQRLELYKIKDVDLCFVLIS